MRKLPTLPKQLTEHLSTLSPSTAGQYRRRLARYHERTGCRLSSITRRSVVDYLTYLSRDCNVSASYQNVALSALRWAVRVTGQSTDLTGLTARRSDTLPAIVSHRDALAVLKRLKGQTWCIVSLVYGAGLSLTEAIDLTRDSIGPASITLNGRNAPLPDALSNSLRGYVLLAGSDGRLFRVNQNTVTQGLRRAVEAAGLNRTVGTRELRNSFAARMLDQGATIAEVKEMMGYRRLDTLLKIQAQIKTRPA